MTPGDRLAELPPHVRALVEKRLRAATGGAGALAPRAEQDRPAPVSSAQLVLWYLDGLFPDSRAYHVPVVHRLTGPLDVDALEAAVATVVRRHEALRTVFAPGPDGEPVQRVVPGAEVPLERLPVAGAERLGAAREAVAAFTLRPFDLDAGPLLRAGLLPLGDGDPAVPVDHLFVLAFHHGVFDHWSVKVLTAELGEAYRAHTEGREPRLPELPVSYGDYAAWQREQAAGPAGRRRVQWWREALDGMPPTLDLPTDRPYPPSPRFVGAEVGRRVPAELADRLRALGKRHDATLFMVVAAALEALLYRVGGQDDFGVSIAVSNRGRSEVERLIGFFVNTVVLRARVSGAQRFDELLGGVKDTALAAFDHQGAPFVDVAQACLPGGDRTRHPLTQVGLSFLNSAGAPLRLPGLTVTETRINPGIVRYDLDVFVGELADGGLSFDVDFRVDVFDAVTVERLLSRFVRLLEEVAADPGRRVGELAPEG